MEHEVEVEATNRWRIKREVSAGDIVAIAVAIVAVLAAYMRLDARVTVVEITTAANTQAVTETVQEIKVELRRLVDKIDRVIERK